MKIYDNSILKPTETYEIKMIPYLLHRYFQEGMKYENKFFLFALYIMLQS